ncbi:hypothetical protein BBK14_11225 [Parafrankia soli]|uniref:HK97 gp10 family phage protein n=1 Tax=Parafrankia soli TaxID=2599596 RepID=A0A1S1R8E6_9ACTN|nr:HK97-gp10 family putative phage morphogenesis protein [Parafrankia soli]OHV42186.1 hypothetical protein BBK14_11225 [Parafrankia soli]
MARRTVVRLEGTSELYRDLARIGGQVGDAVRRAVKASAEAVAADARPDVPVRTGELLSDLDVQVDSGGTSASVGYVDTYYGAFVEFGTSDTPAQPALGPAAERERLRFPNRVQTEIQREIS